MRFCWKASLVWAVFFLALLTSCGSDRTATESPTEPSPPPSATTGEPQPTQLTPSPSSKTALEACNLALQAQTLRPDLIPDWEALGVNACYDLAFDLTSGAQDYTGEARITFTNPGTTSLDDILLRTFPNAPVIFGGSLELNSALINGIDVSDQISYDDSTTARLPLETPLKSGETVVLELEFSGRTPVDFESDFIYGAYHFSTDGQILQLSNAYPMLALLENGEWQSTPITAEGDPVTSPTELYLVEVRAPSDWQVAASGREISREDHGEWSSIHYAGGPLRDFMLAASPDFELTETNWDGIQIRLWGLPGTEAYWNTTLETAQDALQLFDQTYGLLPYNELDIVITPLQNASGVEYPGFILLGAKLYIDEESTDLIPLVTAHEVSHQWWYSVVGNDVINHPWLDEALATYSGLYYEQEFDPSFYEGTRTYYQQRVDTYEAANGEQTVDQPVTAFEGNPRGYATVVYNKGGLFLESLRREIGEKAFDAALNRYYETNLYRIAQPNALLDSFETACSCSLDELYVEWGVTP